MAYAMEIEKLRAEELLANLKIEHENQISAEKMANELLKMEITFLKSSQEVENKNSGASKGWFGPNKKALIAV